MRRPLPWLVALLVAALVGTVFAAVSTYDFVQHLDRQVHALHCSFLPGLAGHESGESGCQVAMMSPYSSVLRSHVWGGLPIALGAMSVFAFLAFYALDLMVTRRKSDRRATGFLALATVLPAAASTVMLVISLTQLGTTCKLCVCIYVASAVCLVCGLVVWRKAVPGAGAGVVDEDDAGASGRRNRYRDEPAFVGTPKPGESSQARLVAIGVATGAASRGFLVGMFALGVAFVAVPALIYLALVPDHARFIGTCEALPHPADSYGVLVSINERSESGGGDPTGSAGGAGANGHRGLDRGGAGGVPAIEVLDPLCPACRAFEQRLAASGLANRLARKAALFPLDNTCNWMVTEATHPGACVVSEAVLCAGARAPDVIARAFDEQERIRRETKADPGAAARIVKQRFPELAACVGSPDARSRLNKSMRWVVANNIRVVTPQLFIDKVKLCDEDVDLGLEYTLSTMLDRHARGTLAAVPLEAAPAASKASAPAGKPAAGKPAGSGGTP
jgi:uncharacterized membrane protein